MAVQRCMFMYTLCTDIPEKPLVLSNENFFCAFTTFTLYFEFFLALNIFVTIYFFFFNGLSTHYDVFTTY